METIIDMNTAAHVTLPEGCDARGVYVDMAEVAGLGTEELLDRISALEQAEAALAELQAAVLNEMARRWGTSRARGA